LCIISQIFFDITRGFAKVRKKWIFYRLNRKFWVFEGIVGWGISTHWAIFTRFA
jgi:hypothetical protein